MNYLLALGGITSATREIKRLPAKLAKTGSRIIALCNIKGTLPEVLYVKFHISQHKWIQTFRQ